jgi:hypothetical protein
MVMVMSIFGISCCAKTTVPKEIQRFVTVNFPSSKIVKVETDRKYNGIEHEIRLDNGAKIDFDTNNTWESIDCKKASVSVPVKVLPQNIAKYIANSYPSQTIIEIDKDTYGYELKLDNRLELIFDKNGTFIRIDN